MAKVKDLEERIYNKGLKAPLIECHFDYIKNWVELFFYEGDNPDMNGAIKFAQKIMPNVRAIYCYSGYIVDTSYHLRNEKWEAKTYPIHGEAA